MVVEAIVVVLVRVARWRADSSRAVVVMAVVGLVTRPVGWEIGGGGERTLLRPDERTRHARLFFFQYRLNSGM